MASNLASASAAGSPGRGTKRSRSRSHDTRKRMAREQFNSICQRDMEDRLKAIELKILKDESGRNCFITVMDTRVGTWYSSEPPKLTGKYVWTGLRHGRILYTKVKTLEELGCDKYPEKLQEEHFHTANIIQYDLTKKAWTLTGYSGTLGNESEPSTAADDPLQVSSTRNDKVTNLVTAISSSVGPTGVFTGPKTDEECDFINDTRGELIIVLERTKLEEAGKIDTKLRQTHANAGVTGIVTPANAAQTAAQGGVPLDGKAQATANIGRNTTDNTLVRYKRVTTLAKKTILPGGQCRFQKMGASTVKFHMQRRENGCLGSEVLDAEWGKIITVIESVVPLANLDPVYVVSDASERQNHAELCEKISAGQDRIEDFLDDGELGKEMVRAPLQHPPAEKESPGKESPLQPPPAKKEDSA